MTTTIQFKLTNGDEILCEVLEEPTGDDVNLVIRNAMKVITIDRHDEGYRYYTFRPWMVYQDREDYMQLLNYTHIIGEAKPSYLLDEQYKIALENERKGAQQREDEVSKKYEEVMQKLQDIADSNNEEKENTNVIKFKDKDKLH